MAASQDAQVPPRAETKRFSLVEPSGVERSAGEGKPQAPPARGGKTIGGFAENTIKDFADIVKGIGNFIVTGVPTAVREGGYILKHAGWIEKADVGGELARTTRALGDAAIAPYAEYGWETPYYKPATTVLDALTIYSAAARLGLSGARLAGSAGAAKAFEAASAYPVQLFGKAVTAPMRLFGISPEKRRLTLQLLQETRSRAAVAEKADRGGLVNGILKKLSAENLSEIDRAIEQGRAAPFSAPEVEAGYNAYRDYLAGVREKWILEHGLADQAVLDERVAKQYALSKYGKMDPEALATARQEIEALPAERRPLYKPTERELRTGMIDELLTEPSFQRTGKVPFLERFRGGRPFPTDPLQYVPRVIRSFRKAQSDLEFAIAVQQEPALARAGLPGEAARAELLPSQGIYKRYLERGGGLRAKALYVRELESVQGTTKAAALLASDPGIQARLKAVSNVILDPTARRIVLMEFSRVGGPAGAFLRLYDRLLGLFKKSATLFNPRYYTGNPVGDAVLSVVAGTTLGDLRLGEALKSVAPAQARIGGEFMGGPFRTLYDFVNDVDAASKRGVIVHEVRRRLIEMGVKADMLHAELARALPALEHLGESKVARQLLHEEMAARALEIPGVGGEIERLAKSEAGVSQKISSLALPGSASLEREAALLRKAGELEVKRAALVADAEKAVQARRAAAQRIKQLVREGQAGLAKRLARAMKEEERASRDFYRDYLKALRSRGGIRLEGEAAQAVPKGLRASKGKGVLADELAQELHDHFGIGEGYQDDVVDFIQKAVEEARKSKPDAKLLGGRAREISQGMTSEALKEVISTTRQIAQLRRAAARSRSERALGEAAARELSARRSRAVEAMEAERQGLRHKLVLARARATALSGDLEADAIRSGALGERIAGLEKDALLLRPAVERGNNFFGNYMGLGPVEQYVFRRLIPFYAFNKAMTMLAFRLPFEAPLSTFAWHRMSVFQMSQMGDPDLPDWMREAAPVFALENGDTVWIKLSSLLPFSSVRVSKLGGVPIPAVANVAEQNFFVSAFLQMAGAPSKFQRTGIPYGEPMVSLHNGEVMEFTPEGKLRRTIPQLPMWKGIAHMFPTVQLAEALIFPYQMTRRGWLLSPEPVLNPDGSVKYPREAADYLRSLTGVQAIRGKGVELRAREKGRVIEALRSMKSAWRRAQPEERDAIEEAFRDYARGKLRIVRD